MDVTDLAGKTVNHIKYGIGIVTKQSDKDVEIQFDAGQNRKFQFPESFKMFLHILDDEKLQKEILELIAHKEHQAVRANEERQEIIRQNKVKSIIKTMETEGDVAEFSSVEDFCEAFKRTIAKEVDYLRTTGGKKYRVFDGKCVERNANSYTYIFEAEDELKFPDGTEITVWVGDSCQYGTILGCEEFTIIIKTSDDLGMDVPSIQFTAEPWHLLESLRDRLSEIKRNPSKIVRELVTGGSKAIDTWNHSIITGQEKALKMGMSQPITFIWGPPGTGKTHTLSELAIKHVEAHHKVLMMSYSNVSVDGAIEKTIEKSSTKLRKPGVMIRYGYPRSIMVTENKDNPYLTSYKMALKNNPELIKMRESLIRERGRINKKSARYVKIEQELNTIRKSLKHEEHESVRNAMFVATTVSKAIVDDVLRQVKWDVVIFDEASMAYIPQIVFAASLAKTNFICMGDFRQLPPIVQSTDANALSKDIFRYCKIDYAVDHGWYHRWLCMLNVQYRMHPDISDIASRFMYNKRLIPAENMAMKRKKIVDAKPFGGYAVGLADLSNTLSVCMQSADKSHFNVFSAFSSILLTVMYARHFKVGIITPYHAQSRLLHFMVRDIAENLPRLKDVVCATVHAFQGSEQEVIIYDAVDCYRMSYPGMLISSTKENYANRLFNVALTRAKGKFIAVTNVDYMKDKGLSDKLMFKQIITSRRHKGTCLNGSYITTNGKLNECIQLFREEDGFQAFLGDIGRADKEVRIDIPSAPDNKHLDELTTMLKYIKNDSVDVVIRAESKRKLPAGLRELTIENHFVYNPVCVIDNQIVWYGMPASRADFIVNNNPLKTLYRPIIRFRGKYTAKGLIGLLEMNRTLDQQMPEYDDDASANNFAAWLAKNYECDTCGKSVVLRKSRQGKFFLGCSGYPRCQTIDRVEKDMVDEYLNREEMPVGGQRCPKCGYSMETNVGPYGLYVRCLNNPLHRYRLDEI